jgi:hypothetical protein
VLVSAAAVLWRVELTCEHDWVLSQRCTHCLGQQCSHGDPVWLEALVQGVKLVSLHAHAHTELRHLADQTHTQEHGRDLNMSYVGSDSTCGSCSQCSSEQEVRQSKTTGESVREAGEYVIHRPA